MSSSSPSPVILLLVGPKGSGKTHIGSLVQAALGIPFLRVEPIFLENARTSRLAGSAQDAESYAKVFDAVASALARVPRLAMESTGASEAFPGFLRALRSRWRVILVAVRAPPERCVERVRSRDQSQHIPVSDDRVIEINARAAAVELPWDLVIDNGGPAAPAAILDQLRPLLPATG